MNTPITRRQSLRTMAGAAAGLLTAACTGTPAAGPTSTRSGGPVELTFWAWVPGIDKVVALWNAQRPDIQVKFTRVPAGRDGAYGKIYAGLEAGAVPDLCQIELSELPSMLMHHALLELGQHGIGDHRATFVDWTWEQSSFAGGMYAVPQASGPMAMFYRRDLFDSWGIAPPATWADYEAAARQIRTRRAHIGTFPASNSQFFAAMSWQAGSIWFSADQRDWLVGVDGTGSRKAGEFWQRLVERDLALSIPTSGNDWFTRLQDGKIATMVGAQWHAAILRGNVANTAGRWAVARMPQWEQGGTIRSANMGGSTTGILSTTRYPKQALEFALWLNTDPRSVDLLVRSGYGWPALRNTADIAALQQAEPFFSGQRINDVFVEADGGIDNRWKWLPTTSQALEHVNSGLQEAVTNRTSFGDVVATAQQRIIRDLEKKGLPYRTV